MSPDGFRHSQAPSGPARWLRFEAALLFGLSLLLYASFHRPWLYFLLGFFLPDLSCVGYLGSPKAGSLLYNIFHSLSLPLGLGLAALIAGQKQGLPYLAVWLAHIAFDRFLGFGLKYPESFKDTHLQRL